MVQLVKYNLPSTVELSIDTWKTASTKQNLSRAKDIERDKERAVKSFFALVPKEPDGVTAQDVLEWHQTMLVRNLSEYYIYASLAHLSSYFEWLRKLPEFTHFIKFNPVRAVLPKPPKKYNSHKVKSLTDEELSKLWLYLENLAKDDKNLVAVRDYAIFRLFMATGMRREEILAVRAEDIKIEDKHILIHTRVKGGTYEWRTITDEEVKETLERYLRLAKRKSLVGVKERALWIRFDRAKRVAEFERKQEDPFGDEPRLSSHSFDKQMKRYATAAGIGHFHLHKFRHTFARIVSEESGSLIETQDALGHKDIQTTQIYVNRIKFKKDKFSRSVRDRIKPVE